MSVTQPIVQRGLDVKPTLGWLFIGVIFSAVFYGVTVVQTLFYYQTYPSDSTSLKIVVFILWVVDTLSLIMLSHGTYTWLVIDFSNPFAINGALWSIFTEPLCAALIALCVHLSMAYRIFIFDRKLLILAIAIAVVSFVPFSVAIAAVVQGLRSPGGVEDVHQKIGHSVMIIAVLFTATLDIVIAITLIVLIRKHKTASTGSHLKRTDRMIFALTVYLLTNNLLTTLITTSSLITFFAVPDTLVYVAFDAMISKAYTNTFLSQLNARESIRGKGTMSSTHGSSDVKKNTLEPMAFHLRQLGSQRLHADEFQSEASSGDVVTPSPTGNGFLNGPVAEMSKYGKIEVEILI